MAGTFSLRKKIGENSITNSSTVKTKTGLPKGVLKWWWSRSSNCCMQKGSLSVRNGKSCNTVNSKDKINEEIFILYHSILNL